MFSNTPIVVGVAVAAGLVLLVTLLARASGKKVAELKARGLYPDRERATEADVLRLLSAGEKIGAIRLYREMTGLGLKEAKDAVDEMEQKLPR
jgi:ribosomal protein L7/L12